MHSDYDTVEYRVTKADGRILWLFDKAQLVRDESGRSWFYVIVMDITSLRNTQQELKISEERYRILTELSERIIFEHDIQTLAPGFRPGLLWKIWHDPAVDSAFRLAFGILYTCRGQAALPPVRHPDPVGALRSGRIGFGNLGFLVWSRPWPFSTNRASPYGSWAKSRTSTRKSAIRNGSA